MPTCLHDGFAPGLTSASARIGCAWSWRIGWHRLSMSAHMAFIGPSPEAPLIEDTAIAMSA
eukprot:9333634-Pyramimonas_sp.AAC.1